MKAEEWVRKVYGNRIRRLDPRDRKGDTIVWKERDVLDSSGVVIGRVTISTYVSDFVALAKESIDAGPDDRAIRKTLRERELEPEDELPPI